MTTVSPDSTGCVHRFIGVGLAIHLQGEVLVLRLPHGLEAGNCGKGPANLVGWNKGRSPIHQLLHLFVLLLEGPDLLFVLPGRLFMGLLHFCQFPLKSQHHCYLVCFGHPLTCHTAGRYHLLWFLHTILSAPRWVPIVLERVWNLENDCSCFHLWSVYDAPNSLLHLPPLVRLAPQTGMVLAEGTPTLKSVGMLALRCQSTIDNDVPFLLEMRVIYITLMGLH